MRADFECDIRDTAARTKRQIRSNTVFHPPVLEALDFCFPRHEVAVTRSLEGHDLEVVHVDVQRVRLSSWHIAIDTTAWYAG